MNKVGIVGVGKYLPEKILTNRDLERMVDTTDEWIMTRTGIRERRIAKPHTPASRLGTEAAKGALLDAGLPASKVELIVVATITPDMQFPSTSCLIQAALDCKDAACFDIAAACSGYIFALDVASQYIANGRYKNALVVGAEVLSNVTDWTDRSTCILFGDGAGACVLKPTKRGGIISTSLGSDGLQADLLKLPAGGSLLPASHKTIDERLHYIKMSGNEVFKSAVRIMATAAKDALHKASLKCQDVDLLIPHQANIRIIQATVKRLGLSPQKVYLNIDKYGNMSSASTAVALCEAVQEDRIRKGDVVVLVAFGSGLTWGASVIEW